MSELQPLARGDLVGPAGSMPADAPTRTFWGVVGQAYWRGIMNRVATFWVALIIALTVLVPFLANEAPYTAVIEQHPLDARGQPLPTFWAREWPLFRDLTRVDWIWLAWGAAAVALLVMRSWNKWRRRRTRSGGFGWKAVAAVLAAATLVSVGVAAFKTDYLDARDYHRLTRDGALREAVFPPLRWGYAEQEPLEAEKLFKEPSPEHWLGTDQNGRDVLSRLLWGARVVLEIGLVSEVIALVIGAVYGALMGYFVGTVDLLGMRFVEVVEAIPLLFLLITIVAVFGRQFFVLMVIIGVTGWTGIARFVRAEFLRIRQADYVAAARAMGLPLRNILFRHMLPNGLTPVIVSFTFGVAGNIVSESILSFLGIGVEPPTASWGAMLADAGDPGVVFRWWLALAPGIMIFITVFAYNIMGEGLRDAIDPRLNKLE